MAARAFLFLSALVATLTGFTVTARAANLVDPADGSLDVARSLYQALTGGHYAWAAALALVAAVALLRKFGGSRWPALHTDAGAAMLALGGAFGTAMAAGLAGGGAVTWSMLATAGATAFAAMGGYTAVKHLAIQPYVIPWTAKAPAWAKPILQLVVLWFVHKSDAEGTPGASGVSSMPANNTPASGAQ